MTTLKMDYTNPPDGVNLSKWTVSQLKTLLKACGAQRTGKKANLVTLYILKHFNYEIMQIPLSLFFGLFGDSFVQGAGLL